MSRRKRIAIVVPDFSQLGGLTSVADFLVNALLEEEDFEPVIASIATSRRDRASASLLHPSSWRKPRVRVENARGQTYTHFGVWFAEFECLRYRSVRKLRSLLKTCDLVQVVGGSPAWALAARKCRRPIVLQVATLTKWERERKIRSHPNMLRRNLERLQMLAASYCDSRGVEVPDAVCVENRRMLAWVESRRNDGVLMIPPGVDVARFAPANGRRDRGRPYILSVGRFTDPRKNVALLIEAYSELSSSLESPPPLVLAGSELPPRLQEEITRRGLEALISVVVRPSGERLVELYQGALAFALSSEEEGLGIAIMEAMASGLPVVATACIGPVELVDHGATGYLTPLGDAPALARHLRMLIDDPALAAQLGMAGRNKIERKWSAARAGGAFIALYKVMTAKEDESRAWNG